jgi:glycosyltransferase involved in cell wall biosynthesis
VADKKIKILTISDHPFSPSGVGTQTRYICESLLKTGKFSIVSIGGAIKHDNYQPMRTHEWGDDWTVYPVDGYGNQEVIRSLLRNERPDILWFMTDPRFYGWLWEMENEIRACVPMVYYHVWDNGPAPTYNNIWYESTDYIATISKVTDDIVKAVAPNVESRYVPHSVNTDIFKKHNEEDIAGFKKEHFGEDPKELEKFTFFWNNRNARRKQSGSLIFWFKTFLDKVGHDKARLVMHTEVNDPHGQDLLAIIKNLGINNGEVTFSQQKIPPEGLSLMYNMADCTINIADAEGFGLATLESLACETPIIVTMTGGLQEQVTDGEEWFGIGINPTSRAVIGSQDIPWIYEDRVSEEVVVDAMLKMFNMKEKDRKKLGERGRQHVQKNYNFEDFCTVWPEILTEIHEKKGSWETRKNYNPWSLIEV